MSKVEAPKKTWEKGEFISKGVGALHLVRCIQASEEFGFQEGSEDNRCLPGVIRAVAVAIALHINSERSDYKGKWVAWPSYQELVAETGFSEDTCKKVVRYLIEMKYLRKLQLNRSSTCIFSYNYDRIRKEGVAGFWAKERSKEEAERARRLKQDALSWDSEANEECFGIPGLASEDEFFRSVDLAEKEDEKERDLCRETHPTEDSVRHRSDRGERVDE